MFYHLNLYYSKAIIVKQCFKTSKMEMQTFKCVSHYRSYLKQSWHSMKWTFHLFPEMPGSRQKLINLTHNKWSLIIFNQCFKKTTSPLQSLRFAKDSSSRKKRQGKIIDIQNYLFCPHRCQTSLHGKRNNLSSLSHSHTQVHAETRRSKEKCPDDGTICSRWEFPLSRFFSDQ